MNYVIMCMSTCSTCSTLRMNFVLSLYTNCQLVVHVHVHVNCTIDMNCHLLIKQLYYFVISVTVAVCVSGIVYII